MLFLPWLKTGLAIGQLAGDALGSLVECNDADSMRTLHPNGIREFADGRAQQSDTGHPRARRRRE